MMMRRMVIMMRRMVIMMGQTEWRSSRHLQGPGVLRLSVLKCCVVYRVVVCSGKVSARLLAPLSALRWTCGAAHVATTTSYYTSVCPIWICYLWYTPVELAQGPFKCLKSVLWETLPSANVAPLALQPLPITPLSVLSAKCLLRNTVLSMLLDESNFIDLPCKRIHALIWQLIDWCTKIRYPLTFNVICSKLSTFKLTKSQWSASWECLHRYDSPLIGAALK